MALTEAEGCEVLDACFRRAGLDVARNVVFDERGIKVTLDGWDAKARVGFELITTEAGDRAEFTPDVVAALEERMEAEELFLFLVDEQDVPSAEVLEQAAERFLALLRDQGTLA
ncbi:MAG: hypothetical protein KC657_35530 [Myxococcales bacterium]|nr:hypothetical protein [Myxococcales bacterium]